MDIGALSTSIATNRITGQVGMAVLSKVLDTQQAEADGVMKMIDSAAMERSVNPAVGSNFDMSV